MINARLRVRPCFAGPDALGPRVTKLGVTTTSAVSKPRTPATTATGFAGFLDGAAFGTCGTDRCRGGGCRCSYVAIRQRHTKGK